MTIGYLIVDFDDQPSMAGGITVLGFAAAERHRECRSGNRLLAVVQINLPVLLLVLRYIVLQSEQKAFGILGGHNDAALYSSLLHAGEYARKIHHELRLRVRDHSEVGVRTGSFVRRDTYVHFLLFHNCAI